MKAPYLMSRFCVRDEISANGRGTKEEYQNTLPGIPIKDPSGPVALGLSTELISGLMS